MNKKGRVASAVLVALVVLLGLGSFTSLAAPSGPTGLDAGLQCEGSGAVSLPESVSAEWWAAIQQGLVSSRANATNDYARPVWSQECTNTDALYGMSVNTAGDVNGDGYDDVIVGALRYDSTAQQAGRAWVFHGSATGLSLTPDQTLDPPTVDTNGFFGVPAGTAGNVNCDGYDDVIVGMQNYDGGSSDEGAVFVYYGSATGIPSSPSWRAESNSQWAHFGAGAGTAGDVNGDGCDDIIASGYCPLTYPFSKALVWYGAEMPTGLGPNGTPLNADWTANDAASWTSFGSGAGAAGDVNGDTYDDIWVGAPFYDHPQVNEGAVFVWYGGPMPGGLGDAGTPANADWMAETNQVEARLGSIPWWGALSMGTAGDVNGDGYDDFVAGSLYYDNPDSAEGAVFLWHGAEVPTGLGDNGNPTNADWTAEGEQVGATLGVAAGTAGDFNGDGYDDVIAGAYGYDAISDTTPITNAGAAMIWYGSADGMGEKGTPANADWMAIGSGQNDYLGMTAAAAGDVNGGGKADVIVGAVWWQTAASPWKHGAAYVYYGPTSIYLPLIIRNY